MIRQALIISFATCIFAACATHVGRPDDQKPNNEPTMRVTVDSDIVYTPSDWPQTLTADIYKPITEEGGPYPGVVMIHGGGWSGRSRADMDKVSRAVAERGYVVMNISYRFAPKYHFPAQLQDVDQAVKFLRGHAGAYNMRPDRIGAWGYSAGAHLAALLGVTSPGDKQYVEGTRVQAVVAGGTPVDIRYFKTGALTNDLMGVPFEKDPELWREASPIALVSRDDPPMFLYHGSFDFTVGVKNSEDMYSALNQAHVPTELFLMRGLDHLSTFFVNSPVEQGIEFLDRYLR